MKPRSAGTGNAPARGDRAVRTALTELPEAEVRALLDLPTSAVIAFVDGKGYPRLVPCWFLWWEDAFYTTSGADKFHVRSIRANPRGSFCVERQELTVERMSNRQVKGVGTFEILESGVAEWGARIRRKYLGSTPWPVADSGEGRIVLRLAPERLSAHGGRYHAVARLRYPATSSRPPRRTIRSSFRESW